MHGSVVVTGEITRRRFFNFDHTSARLRETGGSIRRRNSLFDRDDEDARERGGKAPVFAAGFLGISDASHSIVHLLDRIFHERAANNCPLLFIAVPDRVSAKPRLGGTDFSLCAFPLVQDPKKPHRLKSVLPDAAQTLRKPAFSYRVTGGGTSRLTTTSMMAGLPDSSARRRAGMNCSGDVTRSPWAPKAWATSANGTSRNSLASGHISSCTYFCT